MNALRGASIKRGNCGPFRRNRKRRVGKIFFVSGSDSTLARAAYFCYCRGGLRGKRSEDRSRNEGGAEFARNREKGVLSFIVMTSRVESELLPKSDECQRMYNCVLA